VKWRRKNAVYNVFAIIAHLLGYEALVYTLIACWLLLLRSGAGLTSLYQTSGSAPAPFIDSSLYTSHMWGLIHHPEALYIPTQSHWLISIASKSRGWILYNYCNAPPAQSALTPTGAAPIFFSKFYSVRI